MLKNKYINDDLFASIAKCSIFRIQCEANDWNILKCLWHFILS